MRKVILVITLASAILMVSTCAKREEGRCRLRYRAVNTSESTIYFACQDQMRISERPAQLKDLPKGVSRAISYFLAKIGDRDIPLIIEGSKKFKLYLDTDGDGSLSDERGFAASTVKKRRFGPVDYYRFGPISLEFGQAERKLAKRIYVITRGTNIEQLCFCPADYRKGKVRLGEYIYSVAVVDGNFDGKYGKIFSPPIKNIFRPGCDSFAIDLNRDGRLDWALYERSELTPLSRMIKIEDTYYSIDVATNGTALELKKVEPEFGILDLGGADVKMKLWSDAAEQNIIGSEENRRFPAGKYKTIFLELNQKDSSGNRWTLTSSRAGKLEDFEIRPGRKSSFKIGPPFQIKTTARRTSNDILIGLNLEGQAGEQYGADVGRNGIRVSPPVFKIIDESGNVVDTGRFKYG